MSEQYVDILTRLQAISAALGEGEQKDFYDEIINEIASLRQALTIFSDEFEKIQAQDEQREQMGMGVPYPVQ